jgi:hypothetical protein
MDAERVVKISRYYIPAGRRSPGCPKRRWSDLKQAESPTTKRNKKDIFIFTTQATKLPALQYKETEFKV